MDDLKTANEFANRMTAIETCIEWNRGFVYSPHPGHIEFPHPGHIEFPHPGQLEFSVEASGQNSIHYPEVATRLNQFFIQQNIDASASGTTDRFEANFHGENQGAFVYGQLRILVNVDDVEKMMAAIESEEFEEVALGGASCFVSWLPSHVVPTEPGFIQPNQVPVVEVAAKNTRSV